MKIIKNKKSFNKIYFLFFVLITLYLLFKLLNCNKIKEHYKKKKKKKKKSKYKYGSYQYIAEKGSVKGKDLVNDIGMNAAGIIYGIELMGDFVTYLIVDVPNDIMKLADGGSKDPIGQVFG
jgi:hypothetical protein